MAELKSYFSVTDAARLLEVNTWTIYKAIDAGVLPTNHPKGAPKLRRIHRDDLEEWWGAELPDSRKLKKEKGYG